jgi:hypothetical protein
MKTLSEKDFLLIRSWIYRIARPIEVALWNYHFENGSKEAVLSALSAYQNEDGGFGHALEPDNWNPASSPNTTCYAVAILDEIDFDDKHHPILQGILRYIDGITSQSDTSLTWSIPTNNNYAHASWYTYHDYDKEVYSEVVATGLAFFMIRHTVENSEVYHKAEIVLESIIKKFDYSMSDFLTISGYCDFVNKIEKYKLSSRFDVNAITDRLPELVWTCMERDPFKWAGWCGRPSFFIKSPECCYYKGNEEIMSAELDWQLDRLISGLPELNVWNVNADGWYWFDNNQGGEYPMESFVSANCWAVISAISNIKLFIDFRRADLDTIYYYIS